MFDLSNKPDTDYDDSQTDAGRENDMLDLYQAWNWVSDNSDLA